MSIGIAAKAVSIVVAGIVFASASVADAATCGDANRTGSVTVTDGVLVLRAAASLPSNCPQERCDMNVDGGISVTDGVLALRVAAGIQAQVACSATQADTIFGSILKTVGASSTASPAGRARAAGTTEPCSGGGFIEDDGFTRTFNECAEGDFITNGTLTISDDGQDTVTLFFDTTDFVISTGEVLGTFGGLEYFFGVDTIQVNGVLGHAGSIIGSYTDEFSNVQLDQDFFVFGGTVTTTITEGSELFADVSVIVTTIFSPTLAQIGVNYTDGTFDLFTLADGVCEPCSSGCGNESLTCLSCVGDCSNSSARCGVDFDYLDCDDGIFGPSGLCEPCSSDDQCNGNDGLSCFDCGQNCSGNTRRCGSSKAFVECEDGAF
ncbi:MAG: hypothetical protein ABI080_24330 [Candidatus Binatia bacterium]